MKKMKRIIFNEDENLFIYKLVKLIGPNWVEISKGLPGRTPKQIRDRYMNYLRDGLNKSPWTLQEDFLLIQMHKYVGPKWSKMAIKLPGRSANDIKNRWYKHLCKKNIQQVEIYDNCVDPQNIPILIEDSNDSSDISQSNKTNETFPNFFGLIETYTPSNGKKTSPNFINSNNHDDFEFTENEGQYKNIYQKCSLNIL